MSIKNSSLVVNEPINEPIKLSNNAKFVLAEIRKNLKISQPELAKNLSVSLSKIKRSIKELTEANILIGKTSNKAGRWIINK